MSWFDRLFKKQRKQDKVLCDCDTHKTEREVYCDVPLVGGSHTSFYVSKCKECGGWLGFPHFNFLLAVEEGTEKTIEALEKEGVPVKPIQVIKGGLVEAP